MGIIYSAKNKVNEKVYIGKTYNPLYVRKNSHKYDAKRGEPSYFYNALRKYDWDDFDWNVELNTDYVDFWEKVFINNYKSQGLSYNLKPGGDGGPHTEETKKKISESQKGKIRSKEAKEKNRIAHLGKIGSNRKPFILISPDGIEKKFITSQEASNFIGTDARGIRRFVSGKTKKLKCGWILKGVCYG